MCPLFCPCLSVRVNPQNLNLSSTHDFSSLYLGPPANSWIYIRTVTADDSAGSRLPPRCSFHLTHCDGAIAFKLQSTRAFTEPSIVTTIHAEKSLFKTYATLRLSYIWETWSQPQGFSDSQDGYLLPYTPHCAFLVLVLSLLALVGYSSVHCRFIRSY